jgi:DNA-binding transcriptional MerR regulator
MDTQHDEFTIQQVAEATGLSRYTLRYYERIGLIHPIDRAGNTHRRYSADDVNWLAFLTKLRATGMSIRQMQLYTALQRQGDETLAERLEMLKAHRRAVESRMKELQVHLQVICCKIDIYEQIVSERAVKLPEAR